MGKDKPIRSIDPVLTKCVGDLQGHLRVDPSDRGTIAALDGIADSLIDAILQQREEVSEKETLKLLQTMAEILPGHPRTMLRLSKVFIDRMDHKEALIHASAGLANDPENADLLFNHALCLLELGNLEEGISELRSYVESEPDNPWAYNNIGDAYRSLKIFDEAEAYFHLALKKNERFGPAYHNLALLYMDQGEWERCVHYARMAEAYQPFDKDMQLALGDAFGSLGFRQESLEHLVRATLIDPEFVEAYESMAATYADLGMSELAVAAAERALSLNPDSSMALANLGYAYRKKGEIDKAIECQLQALDRNPDPEARYKLHWELGWDFLLTDRYAEALEYTDKAIAEREYPDLALYFNKGLIFLAQGKQDEAEEAYGKALQRSGILKDYGVIMQAMIELRQFIALKGLEVDDASKIFELLQSPRPLK